MISEGEKQGWHPGPTGRFRTLAGLGNGVARRTRPCVPDPGRASPGRVIGYRRSASGGARQGITGCWGGPGEAGGQNSGVLVGGFSH